MKLGDFCICIRHENQSTRAVKRFTRHAVVSVSMGASTVGIGNMASRNASGAGVALLLLPRTRPSIARPAFNAHECSVSTAAFCHDGNRHKYPSASGTVGAFHQR